MTELTVFGASLEPSRVSFALNGFYYVRFGVFAVIVGSCDVFVFRLAYEWYICLRLRVFFIRVISLGATFT